MNHIEGSHYILVKDGSNLHLSIPVHKGKDLGIGLLKKLIEKAGLTNQQYVVTSAINEARVDWIWANCMAENLCSCVVSHSPQ